MIMTNILPLQNLKVNSTKFCFKISTSKFSKNDKFDAKLISLNRKINSNKTKYVLVENELKKHLIQVILE